MNAAGKTVRQGNAKVMLEDRPSARFAAGSTPGRKQDRVGLRLEQPGTDLRIVATQDQGSSEPERVSAQFGVIGHEEGGRLIRRGPVLPAQGKVEAEAVAEHFARAHSEIPRRAVPFAQPKGNR
jgi:hypothetical protein